MEKGEDSGEVGVVGVRHWMWKSNGEVKGCSGKGNGAAREVEQEEYSGLVGGLVGGESFGVD